MTVDIDIGIGSDELEDEDVVSVEEVEEVEAVEVPKAPKPVPLKAPPSAVKKPNPWVKRILVIVVAAILVTVGLWAVIYFGTRITDITVGLSVDESNYPDTIKVSALVATTGSASIGGKGDLEITYDDDLVYSSRITIDDGGNAEMDVPYNSFIEGNGNYYFQVKYEGKESPLAIHEVRYLVESVDLDVEVGYVGTSGQLNLTLYMQDKNGKNMGAEPKGAEITVTEIKNLDRPPGEISTSSTPTEVDESFLEFKYPYTTKSGNYSFKITIINTRAKSTSDDYEIEIEKVEFLNILPVARGVVTNVQNVPVTKFTATFDASQSRNDGDVTLYVWDFDNDGTIDLETASTDASWTYDFRQQYDARLVVKGDEYISFPGAADELESGVISIRVNPP